MSSRRSSKQGDTGSEFFLECKAAFLSIYDDINDKIESRKRLNNVLQQSGRNPTRAALDKYWPRNTDELSFNDFVDICRKEPVTTADDLMKAFRKIDANGDGYISLDELFKIMNAQGENMSREDVRKMIDEVDENKDGRLDYGEFTNMIMKTAEDSKKISMKVMEKKERKKKRELRNAASKMESDKINDRDDIDNSANAETDKANTESKDTSPDEISEPKGIDGSELEEGVQSGADKYFGSATSLRSKKSDRLGSTTSLRSTSGKVKMGSVRTLQEEQTGGSRSSVRVNDEFGSRSSIRVSNEFGSKASLQSRAAETGSQLSMKQTQGSRSSFKPVDTENMGSRASLRSVQKPEVSAETNPTADTASKDSPKASPRSRSDSASLKKGTTPREHVHKDHSTKETPRRDSYSKNDKPPLPESPKSRDSTTDKSKAKVESPKGNSSKDSARSVSEEINYDDDFDIVSTGRPTPRIDLNTTDGDHLKKVDTKPKEENKKADEETAKAKTKKEDKPNKESAKDTKDENSLGSQTSLRSGDKEISAPVPSPRKNVSRLSEDEVPRPSPRVTKRDSKGKSPSTKGRDKLPDPKSLQDWKHYTSKGCFFYEDDEIVTHVYSLNLHMDSTVYLSAQPIVDEPACLELPGTEPIDTALFVFDHKGKLVTCTEQRDTKGMYGSKYDLSAGEYQVLPYTTGCRFKKRPEEAQHNMKESKLVKTKDEKIVITSAFRKALEDIFDLCDLDNNGTMSRDEFNWFNLRTSGEELGEDEWEVVEEKTDLENGEITKQGFIELNEMEAEDAQGDVEDLWITLTSMGMNKGLIMDEACPYRVDVYVEESGRKKPHFKVTGIESLEKKEYVSEICQYTIEKADEPTKIRNMKDLYMYTYRNEYRASIVIDNKSRSSVTLQVNCSRSKNVVSNRPSLDHTVDIDPQDTIIAHHLLPKSELDDWSISCTETIHK